MLYQEKNKQRGAEVILQHDVSFQRAHKHLLLLEHSLVLTDWLGILAN